MLRGLSYDNVIYQDKLVNVFPGRRLIFTIGITFYLWTKLLCNDMLSVLLVSVVGVPHLNILGLKSQERLEAVLKVLFSEEAKSGLPRARERPDRSRPFPRTRESITVLRLAHEVVPF
jgi:hypothetical protein